MTEEPKEKQDYEFIKEQIVPKRKNKIMRKVWTAVFVICMAVVFGLVAEIVMITSESILREWLGIEAGERQPVDLNRPSPSVEPTKEPQKTVTPTQTPADKPSPKPSPTETPLPTEAPQETLTPVPEGNKTPTQTNTPSPTTEMTVTNTPEPTISEEPEVTKAPTEVPVTPNPTEGAADITPTGVITLTPTQGEDPTKAPEETLTPTPTPDSLYTYLQVHQQILEVAEEAAKSLVAVEAIEEGVDWFQEIYVTRTRTTGLILANDGVDLLILVDLERISGANLIEVYFGENVVSGRIYSLDKNYGIAVIAVPLSSLSTDILKGISIGILADAESIRVGTPVLALGAPNGYENSMEFGMVTSLGSTVSVTDGQVSYFTTDMMERENGYGFVVNLDGEVMGMITHGLQEDTEDSIFSAISLQAIQGVIVKLLNNEERAYFGIKGQDLPRSVRISSGLEDGVYIREVENSSPALDAGIKAGDIMVSFAGQSVLGIKEFHELLLTRSVREIVVVKIMRHAEDGMREMTLEVPLAVKN